MDETKHEVTFTYVDDKTPVIEVIQKVTNEKLPEDTPSVSNPKTGDEVRMNTSMPLWALPLTGCYR